MITLPLSSTSSSSSGKILDTVMEYLGTDLIALESIRKVVDQIFSSGVQITVNPSQKLFPSSYSVIFLDIDGVLFDDPSRHPIQKQAIKLFSPGINYSNFMSIHYDTAATYFFKPAAVANLNHLIQKTNAKVVLSSNWRENRTQSQLKELFAKHSFSNVIIDKTPDEVIEVSTFTGRAKEINAWLLNHPEITSFVILDDYDKGLSVGYPNNFVLVDWRSLLTMEDVEKAIKIVNSNKRKMAEGSTKEESSKKIKS